MVDAPLVNPRRETVAAAGRRPRPLTVRALVVLGLCPALLLGAGAAEASEAPGGTTTDATTDVAAADVASADVAAAAVTAPTEVARAGASGRDYAEEVFGDAWDYRNSEDIHLDANVMRVSSPSASPSGTGTVSFYVEGGAYVSPLWPGYPGSLLNGRDGAAAGNRLDTETFSRVSIRAYSDRDVNSGLVWFDCPGGGLASGCGGGQPFTLRQGWHTYDLAPGSSVYSGWPKAWSGGVTGIRLAMSPSSRARVSLDWIRAYRPGSASVVRWRHPGGGGSADLVWDHDSTTSNNTTGAAGWGVVASSPNASTDTDLSSLPAGTYWLRSRSGVGWSPATRVVLGTPGASITVPDRYGEQELSAVTGRRWDFSQSSDVSSTHNTRDVVVSGGRLSATNAGPLVNDPHVYLNVGSGIDPSRFRRAVVRSSYDGAFDLRDAAGGGTMGRLMWRRSDTGADVHQSQDLLTYPSEREIVVDLGRSDIRETDQASRPWSGAPSITAFRWDPNEDRGARRWHLDDVQLWSEWTAYDRFAVEWTVPGARSDTRVAVVVDTDRTGCNGTTVASGVTPRSQTNVTVWNTASTPPGRYWVCLQTTTSGVTTSRYAESPVLVSSAAGPATVAAGTPSAEATAGGVVARWSLPAAPAGGRTVAVEVRLAGVPGSAKVLHPSVRAAVLPSAGTARVEVRAVGTGGDGAWSSPSYPATPYPAGSTTAPAFLDVAPGASFRQEIRWMADQGISLGTVVDGEPYFRPGDAVSRQAMAAFLYRYSGESFNASGRQTFSDVPASHPFHTEIEWLAGSGVAGGYSDGTYRPSATVTRQAMASFLHRLAGTPSPAGEATFSDVGGSHPFRVPIAWMAGTGITDGYADGSFGAGRPVSRQAMAAFLNRYDTGAG